MEISDSILRVLNNTASQQQATHLRQWISADPANAQEYEAIRLLWQHAQTPSTITALDFQPIQKKIRQQRKRKKIYIALGMALFITVLISINQLHTNTSPKHLRFEQASLAHIASMLQDQYQVQLEISPTAKHCHFTGIIFNDTPAEILSYITSKLNLTLTATGKNTFVITGTCIPVPTASKQKPIHAPANKI